MERIKSSLGWLKTRMPVSALLRASWPDSGSSSTGCYAPALAWDVWFDVGFVHFGDDKGYSLYVRAVRPVEDCATENGDVNADTVIDISDAIAMLGSLFNGDPPALARLCGAGAPSGLPDTGQSACYGIVEGQWVPVPCGEAACAGQDGSHATGCPGDGRFVLNDGGTPEDRSDDTVTDNCTGLMWQRDTADVNADGQSTNQDVIHQWCDALAYCENLSFAGHDDWRLPNVRELQSIVDYGLVGGTSIDPVFGALSVSDSGYWSSVTGVNIYRSSVAWFIDFGIGLVSFNDKVATGRKYVIRAVRPGS